MMHLTDGEWNLLSLTLESPEKVIDMLPLEDPNEISARCDDIYGSREFNHLDQKEWKILEACINNSVVHEELPYFDFDHQAVLHIVDAAYSLQDRFIARFPVPPNQWFQLVGRELVDVKEKRH